MLIAQSIPYVKRPSYEEVIEFGKSRFDLQASKIILGNAILYHFDQPFAARGRDIPLRKATVFGAGRATRPSLLFSDTHCY
jgi:hypothetical protein